MSRVDDRDPGLQPERTALSWTRTGLAAAVAAVALLHLSAILPGRALVPSIAAGGMAATFLVVACTGSARRRILRRGVTDLAARSAAAISTILTVTAVAGAAAILLQLA